MREEYSSKKIKELGSKYLTMIKLKLEYMGFDDVYVKKIGTGVNIRIRTPKSSISDYLVLNKASLDEKPHLLVLSNSLDKDTIDMIKKSLDSDLTKYFKYCVDPILRKQERTYLIVEGRLIK